MRYRQTHENIYAGQFVSVAIKLKNVDSFLESNLPCSNISSSILGLRRGMVLINDSLLKHTQICQSSYSNQYELNSSIDQSSNCSSKLNPYPIIRTGVVWSVKIRINQLLTRSSRSNMIGNILNLTSLQGQSVHIFTGCIYQTAVVIACSNQSINTAKVSCAYFYFKNILI